MADPMPGDIRLWRMRKHFGEWTLRCDGLGEAIAIADSVAEAGWPADLQVHRYESNGWTIVLPAELNEARRRLP